MTGVESDGEHRSRIGENHWNAKPTKPCDEYIAAKDTKGPLEHLSRFPRPFASFAVQDLPLSPLRIYKPAHLHRLNSKIDQQTQPIIALV
jgi:hypothetical protein